MIAEDPYVAHDALELIDVDYDPLPVVISPQAALDPTAPLIRDDKEDQLDNKVYHWEAGDPDATEKAFAEADKVVVTHYPRCHPAPLECCGCVADVNPTTGKATIYMTSQAPHAHRTVFALVAGLPEQNIQIISPDIGGGFGNKVPIYPGYVVATAASFLLGRPVKWIEDRTGNLISTGFARDFYMDGELALKEDGTMTGLREDALRPGVRVRRRAADEVQGRPLPHRHRLVRHPGGARRHRGRVHEQGARRRRRRCSFRVTEASSSSSGSCRRRPTSSGSTPPSCGGRTSSSRTSSRTRRRPASSTTRATTSRRSTRRSSASATRSCARSRSGRGRKGGCSGSASRASPKWSARARAASSTSSGSRCSTRRSCACIRPGRRSSSSASSRRARATRRRSRRSSRTSSASARGHHGAGGRHGQHAVRARHVRVALDADGRCGHLRGCA